MGLWIFFQTYIFGYIITLFLSIKKFIKLLRCSVENITFSSFNTQRQGITYSKAPDVFSRPRVAHKVKNTGRDKHIYRFRIYILNGKCYSQVEIEVDDAGAVLTNCIYEP